MPDMGIIVIRIPEDLDHKFRVEVAKRLGGKKGNLTTAVEEAIKLWIGSGKNN